MHVSRLPNEVLFEILECATRLNIDNGPTYTFGLTRTQSRNDTTALQRYVSGPISTELLRWDATSVIRRVCWKWHEWALKQCVKEVFIQCWMGGEVREES